MDYPKYLQTLKEIDYIKFQEIIIKKTLSHHHQWNKYLSTVHTLATHLTIDPITLPGQLQFSHLV